LSESPAARGGKTPQSGLRQLRYANRPL